MLLSPQRAGRSGADDTRRKLPLTSDLEVCRATQHQPATGSACKRCSFVVRSLSLRASQICLERRGIRLQKRLAYPRPLEFACFKEPTAGGRKTPKLRAARIRD